MTCSAWDLNLQPSGYKSTALTTRLPCCPRGLAMIGAATLKKKVSKPSDPDVFWGSSLRSCNTLGVVGAESGAGGRKFRIALYYTQGKIVLSTKLGVINKCPKQVIKQHALPHINTVGKIIKPAQRAGGPSGLRFQEHRMRCYYPLCKHFQELMNSEPGEIWGAHHQ